MNTKTETKQFQYEIQSYQEECVTNVIGLFENLHQKGNFCDVMTAHHKKNSYNFPVKETNNIDIMMETGTGKTFTFIKTIFELSSTCHRLAQEKNEGIATNENSGLAQRSMLFK